MTTPEHLSPTFADLGVAVEITDALQAQGITRTFAIQEYALPIALDGQDLIGQARTGMGKTLAFGIPVLDRLFDDAAITELDGTPRGLILAPTRELADQVASNLTDAAVNLPLSVVPLLGGHNMEEQVRQLRRRADVIVGTPGRILDLVGRGHLDLSTVQIVVLDEADEMLDLGFLPAIERIFTHLPEPEDRQTLLFSATMPDAIMGLARSMMNRPVHIRAEGAAEQATHETTRQIPFRSHAMDKSAVVAKILRTPGRGKTIIFTRTKRGAARVAQELAEYGFLVGAVHGDLDQRAREQALGAFREGTIELLVATDVAARGIDIDDVTHVINYHVPDDEMTYVHRIGRTGRAGHAGVAVTLVGWDELAKWEAIDQALGLGFGELEEWFSNSEELAKAFDVPQASGPRVGPAQPVFGMKPQQRRQGPPRKRSARSVRPAREDKRRGRGRR